MIEKIFIFILFFAPLVFFHELGHYLFARWFGVKVEVFSIGFGPKIVQLIKGGTNYVISAIPLGGYIKMFGDDPFKKDSIPEEDRDKSFIFKGKWARFWIVLGGPLANFLLAYFIFCFLSLSGEKVPAMRIGTIPSTSKLYQIGLRPGDIIKKVNNTKVLNPTDMVLGEDKILHFITINRYGKSTTIKIGLKGDQFFKLLIKYSSALRMPILVDYEGNLLGLSNRKGLMDWSLSYDEVVNGDNSVYLFYLKNSDGKQSIAGTPFMEINSNIKKSLRMKSWRTTDLMIGSVQLGSAADKAKLKGKDLILALNKQPVYSFMELREQLQKTTKKRVLLSYARKGKVFDVILEPKIVQNGDQVMKLMGVYSAGQFLSPRFVETPPLGFFSALFEGGVRTWSSVCKILDSFKKLIFTEHSFKSLGGPLSIGKVASDSFNTSFSFFLQLMALISINLGIINLFPIPILDGGHILFIFLEILNRGPISLRKMEIAQQIGLFLLLILMAGAIFNDITRLF